MTKTLVERLRDPDFAGSMQHLRNWSELDRLHASAASRIEELERALGRIASRADGDTTEDLPAPLAVAIMNLARQALSDKG